MNSESEILLHKILTAISGQSTQSSSTTTSISGQPVKVSGETIYTKFASGESMVVSVSGQPIGVSGETIYTKFASGESMVVSVSGQPIGISGQVVNSPPITTILALDVVTVTGVSGGVSIGSGITDAVTVRALSGNAGIIWVGGTGDYSPINEKGMFLLPGDPMTLDVDNFNRIQAFASTSGDKLAILGISK